MSAELQHVVNGWLSSFRGREPEAGARAVVVPTPGLGMRRSLYTATTSLSSATVRSLQKKLRDAGFKGATVEPLLRGDGGGFIVQYDGQEYKFWIDEDKMRSNGRGLYHDTVVGKNDMVLHRDHRGRWRIDLVTTASGNHTDVTGRESGAGPNQGYSTAEKAFEGALDEQRRRGLRGKTHVWIQKGDGYEDYVPEGDYLPNGDDGTQQDDYIIHEGKLFRVIRGGKWLGPLAQGNEDTLTAAAAADAREQGYFAPSVFVSRADGSLTQVGHVVKGRYRAGGDLSANGRRAGILPNGMDEFTRSFFGTALWSSTDNSREDGGDPLDANYSLDDIDPHSVQKLSEECEQFQADNAADLEGFDSAQAGHDFWLTRCGHGAGFWDGDYPEPQASRLTKASEDFGNVDLYVGDDGKIYAAGYEPPMQSNSRRAQANGRRTGILSDGTRVNVYQATDGSLDEWTAVMHGGAWEELERDGSRHMLAMDKHARGFSQFTSGQEGRHLGKSVPWDHVPDEIKRHIEKRIVSETMVANPRKKKLTYGDLPASPGRQVLACPGCGEEYSAYRGDYFQMPDHEPCVCGQCGTQMVLAERRPQRGPEPQEARTSPGNRAWDAAEDKGLVRMVVEEEEENYFDVFGEPDTQEERDLIIVNIESEGLNRFASQYRKSRADEWETADSVGMIIGDIRDTGYEDDLKQAALDALKDAKGIKGHKRNPRGSTVDEHAKRELELYIENEYALIGAPGSTGKRIYANMSKKLARGVYDPELAPKAWLYLVEQAAYRYAGNDVAEGRKAFNAATRRAVAVELARAWEAENLR